MEHSDSIYVYLYRSAATIHTKHARPCTSMQAHAHRTDRCQRVYIYIIIYIYMPYLSPPLYLAVLGTRRLCWYIQKHLSRKQQAQYHCGIYTNNKYIPTQHWLHLYVYSIQGPNISYVYISCLKCHMKRIILCMPCTHTHSI